jgi:YkoY family integral membrane protein
MPTIAELGEAFPVIISLIIIEGLLSVDNALAIAAMARHLPEAQQKLALRWGIIGAYGFRGLCMAFAAWIIENPWLKIGGAAYLVYLMCKHFSDAEGEGEEEGGGEIAAKGLIATIISIEIMDLSLSVDNVVAAVAMSPKLWVVCTGVFIGILALRFVAGACIKLIEKFPILEETAFLLIGYVGFILVFELAYEPVYGLLSEYKLLGDPSSGWQLPPGPVHVSALQKFVGIVFIVAVSILYSKSTAFQKVIRPFLKAFSPLMWLVSVVVGFVLTVLFWPFTLLMRLFSKKKHAAGRADSLVEK